MAKAQRFADRLASLLGRKLHGKFEGEIVSDLSSLVCRRTGGSRIKHRVKENWLKMYDKSGLKVPRTRRWRVTLYGRRVMGTSLYLRDHHFPEVHSRIAA